MATAKDGDLGNTWLKNKFGWVGRLQGGKLETQ